MELVIHVEDCTLPGCPVGQDGCEAIVATGPEASWVEDGQPTNIAWRSHAHADGTHAACRLGELPPATDKRTGKTVEPAAMCGDCADFFTRSGKP